jgi:hypothetical protein
MLADFQQALADLTASPELCRAVRADAHALPAAYVLSDRERARLLAIVRHPGMACACTVYRMNRVAPLAMNLRHTLRALGPALGRLLPAYWAEHPQGHAHFYIESERFGRWLAGQEGVVERAPALPAELAAIQQAIAESCAPPP